MIIPNYLKNECIINFLHAKKLLILFQNIWYICMLKLQFMSYMISDNGKSMCYETHDPPNFIQFCTYIHESLMFVIFV